MKGLLAIFFSVVLIASQAVASINGPLDLGKQKASTPKCCGHCQSCNGAGCCVGKNDSGSQQPTPAAPSRGAAQNDLQIFAFVSLLMVQPHSTEAAIAPASFLVRPSVAAPLYQRNCSYLI